MKKKNKKNKKKKKKKKNKKKKNKKKKKKKNKGYDSTISCYIPTETTLTAEDAITCQLFTSHSVWAAGFVHNDDGISVSSFPSSLSTAIN